MPLPKSLKLDFQFLSPKWTDQIFKTNTGNIQKYFYAFPDLNATAEWVKSAIQTQEKTGKQEFAIIDKNSQEFVGLISPDISTSTATIGLWIAENQQGKGYAKEALLAIFNWVWQFPQIEKIEYQADLDNPSSLALANSVNMKKISQTADACVFILERNS